ncbi:MAG: DUF2975 domain-containing protein [Pseudomonadota bacterium]
MVRFVRRLIPLLLLLNWLCAGGFALLLLVSLVEPMMAAHIARRFGPDLLSLVLWSMRAILLLGIVVACVAHVIFRRLAAIVATVAAGDPFVAANARRLRHIAWALLAIQFLDLVYGLIVVPLSAATHEYFGWNFSLTGWLAVLLLFVLSHVFAQGAAMRDDLQGTV